MNTPVLLYKSTCVRLDKAQIFSKSKKFFPIPLPKSSFEGMRGSFCVHLIPDFIFSKPPSTCTTASFLIWSKQRFSQAHKTFSRHPLDFSLRGMRGIFQTAKMPSEPFAFCIKTSAPIWADFWISRKAEKTFSEHPEISLRGMRGLFSQVKWRISFSASYTKSPLLIWAES